MWLSGDRVVHSVSIPSDVPQLGALQDVVAALSEGELQLLDDELEAQQWQIAAEIDSLAYIPEVELRFAAQPVPDEILSGLQWELLLGADMTHEFSRIDLRWRLDVVGIAAQAIADLGSS